MHQHLYFSFLLAPSGRLVLPANTSEEKAVKQDSTKRWELEEVDA